MQGRLVAERYDASQGVAADTPLLSWSLAKSVTSALLGVRTAVPDLAPFSVAQLAGSPVWNATEVAARNITCVSPLRPCAPFKKQSSTPCKLHSSLHVTSLARS
jgi:hypothetical protein